MIVRDHFSLSSGLESALFWGSSHWYTNSYVGCTFPLIQILIPTWIMDQDRHVEEVLAVLAHSWGNKQGRKSSTSNKQPTHTSNPATIIYQSFSCSDLIQDGVPIPSKEAIADFFGSRLRWPICRCRWQQHRTRVAPRGLGTSAWVWVVLILSLPHMKSWINY